MPQRLFFAHNHPSGDASPSTADKQITQRLVDALQLIDVRVLDHIIVGHEKRFICRTGAAVRLERGQQTFPTEKIRT